MPSSIKNAGPTIQLPALPSLGLVNTAAAVKAKTLKAYDKMVPPAPIQIEEKTVKTVKPLSPARAAVVQRLVNFFSMKTLKNVSPAILGLAGGLAAGIPLAIFAGPAMHAAFAGLVASAAFPPVMIAIGATLGAVLLAIGVYKYIKNQRAQLADHKKAIAAQEKKTAAGKTVEGDEAAQQDVKPSSKSLKAVSIKSSTGTTANEGSVPPSTRLAPTMSASSSHRLPAQAAPVLPYGGQMDGAEWDKA